MKTPEPITLGAFLIDRWLATNERQLRFSTWTSYRDIVRTRIVPPIGQLRLENVTGDALNKLYEELLINGRADGSGALSERSVAYTHVVVKAALRDAVRWGLVASNAADRADPPRARRNLDGPHIHEHGLQKRCGSSWTTLAARGWRLCGSWQSTLECGAANFLR